MFEKQSGNPGVDGTVADDEYVQERLSNTASILHLPARCVIFPDVERIISSLAALINVDLLLRVVPDYFGFIFFISTVYCLPVLPSQVLSPSDQFSLALVVHEPGQLGLDHGLHRLGAALGEGLNQHSTFLEVCQLVERTVIFSTSSSNNSRIVTT